MYDPNSNILINWMDYLSYFYFTNYSILIGQFNESNVVGVDLINENNKIYYRANIWWTFSNYIQTLLYYKGICTPNITNGRIGGLYRSVWNSYIEWTKPNAILDINQIPPRIINKYYPNTNITGLTYGSVNYRIQYDRVSNSYIVNITDYSLLGGFFYTIPECFKPIYPISNPQYHVNPNYNLLFRVSKNLSFGQPSQDPAPTKGEIIHKVSPNCMTRQNLSYINPKILPCQHKKRLYLWNKGKPKIIQPPHENAHLS